MSERSSEFEKIAKEEEERKKEKGQKMSRRDFLKKAGLAFGALAIGASALEPAGCAREDKRQEEEEKKWRRLNEEREEMIRKEELEKEIKKDPRAGYVDLDHYLEDYPEIKQNPEQLEEMRKYFENQEKK